MCEPLDGKVIIRYESELDDYYCQPTGKKIEKEYIQLEELKSAVKGLILSLESDINYRKERYKKYPRNIWTYNEYAGVLHRIEGDIYRIKKWLPDAVEEEE